MRYELRDYVIWIVFLASAIGCILRGDREELYVLIPSKTGELSYVSFSKDDKYIAAIEYTGRLRLYNFPSMALIWEKELSKRVSGTGGIFFLSDDTVIVLNQADITDTGIKYSEDTYNIITGKHDYKYLDGSPNYLEANGYYSNNYSANDEFRIRRSGFNGPPAVMRFRYPAGGIGHLYRPEVWITFLSGVVLLFRILRLRRNRRAELVAGKS